MKEKGSDLKITEEMERKKLQDRYIRFDWAIKRLLRQKANFDVLDGFLTVMLNEEIRIVEILESEGNQESADDKFNRVDIKALNSKGEIILVEIQNTRELHYLERILYGVAKAITEHISLGEGYEKIKKVYSISILYFDIGIGTDYIYHGQNHFVGAHFSEIGKRFPHIDLAILENGQYNEDWRYVHTMPEQLPAEIHELDAAKVLPVHNSKFSLSRHAWDEPVHRIEQAATKDSSLHVIHGIIGSPIIY